MFVCLYVTNYPVYIYEMSYAKNRNKYDAMLYMLLNDYYLYQEVNIIPAFYIKSSFVHRTKIVIDVCNTYITTGSCLSDIQAG